MKIEFEKLRKTKSFWAIMLFLVFITSTVAITRSLEVGGSVGGVNPAEPRAENGYFLKIIVHMLFLFIMFGSVRFLEIYFLPQYFILFYR